MYCGWQTRAARIRWGAVVCLLVAFAALGIMYAIVSKDCEVCDEIAHTKDPETGETWASLELCYQYKGAGDLSSVKNCDKGLVMGSFFGFILAAILVLIPCVAMCCAASPATMAAQQRAISARAAQAQVKQRPTKPPPQQAMPAATPQKSAPTPQKSRFSRAAKGPKAKAPADPLSQPAF